MLKANLFYRLTVLLPLPFLALSPVFGGSWAFVALFYLTIFAFLADECLMVSSERISNPGRIDTILADIVPIVLASAHLVLLPVAILTLTLGTHATTEKAVIFLAYSLFFGTVSTANAHELIHRNGLLHRSLGKWVFTSLLFGHHVSAHLSVHHRHAATPLDPNSARLNENVYRFFLRAWRDSFHAGLAAENTRLALIGRKPLHPTNPYVIYCLGALIFLALAFTMTGWVGIAIYLGFAALAQAQLLLSDYVQHYGLERQILPDGKYEPVSIFHSWNAPHVFTSALMLNAPMHSDHHTHPNIHYTELRSRVAEGAPVLPYSLPVMSCLALLPLRWKRIMNPKVAHRIQLRKAGFTKIRPTSEKNPV